ncbi:MAG TPA: formate dehydrogenase accessory sulfurtransferase FdhD [Candidatus Limnocylindrales bacterium]|nr:formate dehydrogenase accessory sulfurtransferase FdhD [Candidatus Limnocylindrales bacterium]
MRQVEMLRLDLSTGKAEWMVDCVAEEVPLQISLNDAYTFVIWCSPSQFKELAVGYLLSEDILRSVDDVESLIVSEKANICNVKLKATVNLDERMKHLRRSTRVIPLIKASTSPYQHDEKIPVVKSPLKVRAQVILDCINQMNSHAICFKKTGGLHDSGIFKPDGTMVAFSEDVGRHNTVDKVIGEASLNREDFGQCFMIITGRVPGDMIYKAAKAGLPIVASVAAVLNSGISSAEKAHIALIGFVRGSRMNIYTGAERIIV